MERVLSRPLRSRPLPGSPDYRWIKLFGLGDRSMTMYFRLTGCFNLGWKHSFPDEERLRSRGCFAIAMVKNPYSWLLSLHRRPYHNRPAEDMKFSSFLQSPWPVLGCEGAGGPLPSPMALWNMKNRAYLNMCAKLERSALIRYEDFLNDSQKVVRDCAKASGVGDKVSFNMTGLSSGAKSRDRGKSLEKYREYYLGEKWKSELFESDIRIINAGLDLGLMEELGYEVL